MVPGSRVPYLPKRIDGLAGIATNLFWSWSRDARALFRSIDARLWHVTWHNPIELLQRVDPARLTACSRDPEFLKRYDQVVGLVAGASSAEGSWFVLQFPELSGQAVAYFCAEFGFHHSVPIYSGGLGVLAGDHCKAASDLGVPLVAVGLMYTRGYFDQRVDLEGRQHDADEQFDQAVTPLLPVLSPEGEPALTSVTIGTRCVHVGAWKMTVGRVVVYLLDTDLEQNDPADRHLSHKLYAGGPELRLRQEWVLGVAGVRVLRAVGVDPGAWHANEGHAGFMLIERLRELVAAGTPFDQAVAQVRATSIFTTHTPVPAGHDVFTREQVEQCTGPVWQELKVDAERFFQLGHHPSRDHGQFHMTAMALRLCRRVNGVAERHGQVSRHLWRDLWPNRAVEQVPIGHVTNGVHLHTWMALALERLLDEQLGTDWHQRLEDPALLEQLLTLDDARLWDLHLRLKASLVDFLHEQARRRWRQQWNGETRHLVGGGSLLTWSAMTIGFARRVTAYKRADLLFRDPERLRRILLDPVRPVQIIFAGKAHPADGPGKQILQRVYGFARDPSFEGHIAFIEDYELHLAHRLVQGVDLWLNVPRPPLEACGTSGMKAALNAVPQLGTEDGWWAEGFTGQNGWLIPAGRGEEDQDARHAEQLYALLEEQVVPLFYDRDDRSVPVGWVQRMKHALRVALERFTARQMVSKYAQNYYVPALRRDGGGDDPPSA